MAERTFSDGITIRNLHDVKRVDSTTYVLQVELRTQEHDFETVNYLAVSGDVAETGRWVYQQILDGNYSGTITDYELPTLTAEIVRHRRDNLLKDSDWTQMPDVSQQTRDLWAPYRQALRDITSQPGFPTNVTWPEAP